MKRLTILFVLIGLLSVACGGGSAPVESAAGGEEAVAETAVAEATEALEPTAPPDEPTATAVPTAEPTPVVTPTPAISSDYSLQQNLAELPPIPRLTLPEGASVYEDGSWAGSPHVEIAYRTAATPEEIETFYRALLPPQGWEWLGSGAYVWDEIELQIRMHTGFWSVEEEEVLVIGIRTLDPAMELPDLPLPEDAQTIAYTRRFQYTTEADFDSLVTHYLDLYRTTLWPAAWQPNLNFAASGYEEILTDGLFHVRFERGSKNRIAVEQYDESDGSQPIGVDLRLAFTTAEDGIRYAGGDCPSGRSFAFTAVAPIPDDLDAFAGEKIGEYTAVLRQEMADNSLELVCARSLPDGYQATYELLSEDDVHFRLRLFASEDTSLRRIALDGLDLKRPPEEQFLFWFDYNVPDGRLEVRDHVENRGRAVTVSEAALADWQETLTALIEHVESLTGAPALGAADN